MRNLGWAIECLVLVCSLDGDVSAQRSKDGCFDRYQMSCENTANTAVVIDPSVIPEEVCTRISLEVFPTEEALLDLTEHPGFLNDIEAGSEFCLQIQQVYHLCFFCLDIDSQVECFVDALSLTCAGKPSQEELLSLNDPLFQSVDDIQHTCKQLETAYAIPEFLKDNKVGMPPTVDLCTKQALVGHLCGRHCDDLGVIFGEGGEGGCFDGPNGISPSCARNTSTKNESIARNVHWCLEMNSMLQFLPFEDSLNISNHDVYLRAIPGNSTDCDEAQLAYSECYWCVDDENKCFSEDNPPSCSVPDAIDETIDFHGLCDYMDYQISRDLVYSDSNLNVSLHLDRLLLNANTTLCDHARQAYHKCRWCHPDVCLDSITDVCESKANIPDDYVLTPQWSKLNISDPDGLENCSQVYEFFVDNWLFPVELGDCYRELWVYRQCRERFCEFVPERPNEINKDYLGATTIAQKGALVWVSRVAAFLSFGGACYVIWSIFSNVKRQKSVYYHLLFGMAIFDIITAAAWVFATAPLPEDAYHVYGASGSQATCKAQAFFIQLGFTSIFYNVSLAIYYVMVVAYNRKESQLKAIQHYLHGFPLLLGIGLALGAIPKYHWIDYGCHILPYSPKYNEGELWPVLVFIAVPLGFSIVAITVAMLVVYWTVNRQTARAKKWQLGKGSLGQLESQVLWQCLFYVLAFYITWPILFTVYLASIDTDGPLRLTLTVAFFAPLQGFNNFLVFVRPKMVRMVRERWSILVPRKQGISGDTTTSQSTGMFRLQTDSKPKSEVAHDPKNPNLPEEEGPKAEGAPPDPAAEGLDKPSDDPPKDCVVHFPDGTSQSLQDANSFMDPSALLPLTKKAQEESLR